MVVLATILFLLAAWIASAGFVQIVFFTIGMTLALVSLWIIVSDHMESRAATRATERIETLIRHDATPSFLCAGQGEVVYRNPAAHDKLGEGEGRTLADVLRNTLVEPVSLITQLEAGAADQGAAAEFVGTHRGRIRVSVHRVGAELYLWRVERREDLLQVDCDAAAWPMMRVDDKGAIQFMNNAAGDLIGEEIESLDQLGLASLQIGQLDSLVTTDGRFPCFLVASPDLPEQRELYILSGIDSRALQSDGWAFFDELPVPLLKLNPSGAVDLSNRLARDLLGVETCKGATFGDLTEGLGRSITEWLDDAAMGRGTIQPEILRVKRGDQEVFVQVTLNCAVENGETVLIAVLQDATKLKSLEAQFVQSQKMQAIGQLAGGVAHDFNNLLTAITGHCDLLLLRHDPGDSDYADLVQINQNANRAAALVGQLLAYSRKQTLRPEVIDMRDTLSDLTHLLNRLVGEKVKLSLTHDPGLAKIRADKRQLEQVIMNLVVNARDAMGNGGEIRVTTKNLSLEKAWTRDRVVVAPGDYVSIMVMDDGHGIAEDKLQKVFEPFFTTKRVGEGTGLGLSTAYGIIKQSGGFIFVDSHVGEGTTFQILLPAYNVEEEEVEEVAPKAPSQLEQSDGVVLLVEDEAPVRAFASRALQLRGFTVLEAECAEDALEILQDQDLSVDVFVTDVVMPGIDGPSWVQKALETRPDVKVVFMSGYAEETFSDAQSKIANSVFLPKPFSLAELTEVVQRQAE